MSRPPMRKIHPIARMFFLDVFLDPRTRPLFIYALCIMNIGAFLYQWLENWSWLDSLYFVVITLATIGYGDFVPTTPITKLLTIFYSLNGIILLLMLFDAIRILRGWDVRGRPTGEVDSTENES